MNANLKFFAAILVAALIFSLCFSSCKPKDAGNGDGVTPLVPTCKLKTLSNEDVIITYEYNDFDSVSKFTSKFKYNNQLHADGIYEYNSSKQLSKYTQNNYGTTGEVVKTAVITYQYSGKNISELNYLYFDVKTSRYNSEKHVYTYSNNAVVKEEYYTSNTQNADYLAGYDVYTNNAAGRHVSRVQYYKDGDGIFIEVDLLYKYYYRANNTLERITNESKDNVIYIDLKYDEKERPVSSKSYTSVASGHKLYGESTTIYTDGKEGVLRREQTKISYQKPDNTISDTPVYTIKNIINYVYECPK